MKDSVSKFIANLLPSRIIYWCGIRMWSYATTGPYEDTVAPNVKMSVVMKRWEGKKGKREKWGKLSIFCERFYKYKSSVPFTLTP